PLSRQPCAMRARYGRAPYTNHTEAKSFRMPEGRNPRAIPTARPPNSESPTQAQPIIPTTPATPAAATQKLGRALSAFPPAVQATMQLVEQPAALHPLIRLAAYARLKGARPASAPGSTAR